MSHAVTCMGIPDVFSYEGPGLWAAYPSIAPVITGHFAAGVWLPEIDFTGIYSLIFLKERESGNQKNLELIHFLEHAYQLNPFQCKLFRLLLCARTRARFANSRALTLGGAIWVCDRCVIFPFVGTETISRLLSLCSVLENYLNKQLKFQGTQEIPQPAIRIRVRVRRHPPSTSSQTHSLIPKRLADLGGTSRLRASPEHYWIPPQFQPPPPNLSFIIVVPLRVRPSARHFPTMMSFLFFHVACYLLAIVLPPFTHVSWLPSNSVVNFSACPAWIANDPRIPRGSASLIYLTNICGLPLMCQ